MPFDATSLRRATLLAALFLPVGCSDAPDTPDTRTADLIVLGDHVLTMEPGLPPIEDGAVVISGDRIVAVGPRADIEAEWSAVRTIPGEGRLVMPGLVNAHTHTSMTLFRGMVDDLELMTWLNDYVFPMEARFVTPKFVRIGTELACFEMIRGGTTTFVDMYFYPDEIAGVVERCGLRAIVAAPHIDFPSPGFAGWDDSFAAAVDFVERRQGVHPRIIPAFGPHAPYTVAPEHLAATVEQANRLGAPVSMHLAEAPTETADIAARFGTSPVRHVAGLGMLDVDLIAAHTVQLDAEDIALLAGAGVGAVHNPTSNLKLASGIAPLPAMLDAGVHVGLGTDGAASNNDLDLWDEIRLTALLHKATSGDPTVIPARTALELATNRGAEAIGLGDVIGRLVVGMEADLIQIDASRTDALPLYDPVSHLVYLLDAGDVTTTIVAGQLLMEDGRVLTIDEAALRAAVIEASADVRAALEPAAAAAPDPTHDTFFASLQALCGQAFEGQLGEAVPADDAFAGQRLVMHVRTCDDDEIRVPFHVGDDRSRTWVFTRIDGGIRLKHDHRHEDGSEDEVTQYGGDATRAATDGALEFPADAFTAELLPAAATNVWTVELVPGRYSYLLRREGTERRFRVDFDLTRPVDLPPAPWGSR